MSWTDDQRERLVAARARQGSAAKAPRSSPRTAVPAGEFVPSEYTVGNVKRYVKDNPGERDAVLAAEQDGDGRSTLIQWLTDFDG